MENLLFTGGSGFLGYNIKPILDQHYDVTTCGIATNDNIKTNLAKEIPQLNQHYDIVCMRKSTCYSKNRNRETVFL